MTSRVAFVARAAALLLIAVAVTACAPKPQSPRIDDSDYTFPDLPRAEVSAREEKTLRKAWEDVLAGRVARAEDALGKTLRSNPGLRPALVVLAFARLRAGETADAEARFEEILRAVPGEAAALVGLASVRRKAGRLEQALPLYMRAARLRPNDAGLLRRTSEVKLAVAESAIQRATVLGQEGNRAEAVAVLRRVIEVAPELNMVRLQLADLLVAMGQRTDALSTLAAAIEQDRQILLRIASIRFDDGDLDGAEAALRRGGGELADDPDAMSLRARIAERRASLALPEQLRAIDSAPRVTRAELAALVIARVDALKSRKAGSSTAVASDLSRTWARPQILRALELGLMDVYPNHTFQPSGVVRRGELAVIAARVLDLVEWGRTAAAAPRDMSPSHLQYGAAVRALGAGVMQNNAAGAFEPWRVVSGAEAKSVVDQLAKLTARR